MDRRVLGVVVVSAMVAGSAVAQPNRIDVVTPSAPELAAFGSHAIGVRTLQVTDRNRPDVSSTKPGGPTVRYDRTLTIEVWYPAAFPLVIVSHGYPGNRYLMSHLGENLASKASSWRQSITPTARTTTRSTSRARSTTARSTNCSC